MPRSRKTPRKPVVSAFLPFAEAERPLLDPAYLVDRERQLADMRRRTSSVGGEYGVEPGALQDPDLWDDVIAAFAELPARHRALTLRALRHVCACPDCYRPKLLEEIAEAMTGEPVEISRVGNR